MKKILIGENIFKSLEQDKTSVTLLKNINLSVEKGEFLSIMGPSGSGKSTLLYALSGMDSVSRGQVIFNGKQLHAMNDFELSEIRRKEMGFIFQNATMLKSLNLIDNICLPAMKDSYRKKEDILHRAKYLMQTVGLSGLEKRAVTEVSGGQLQRASLCRALINDPLILFGDEPTGSLNSKTTDEIIDLLSRINRSGTSILLVTHDLKVAKSSHRVIFIKDGQLVDELQLLGLSDRQKQTRILEKMQILDV